MQLPDAVDRFYHFEFQNWPIIEVRGDLGVIGIIFEAISRHSIKIFSPQ
jgi:hypothetical protein